MHSTLIKEACVETLNQALKAQYNGASRVEVCARLDLDGLTPDESLVINILESVDIPVHVMIRPREGDFVYTSHEISLMESQIISFKSLGVQGVVLGLLDEYNQIDIVSLKRLVMAAKPLKVTFHKAFDELLNLEKGLSDLMKIEGLTHVLTSGGAVTAEEGAEVLNKLVLMAQGQIEIISAGKISNKNLDHVHKLIGGNEYHGKLIAGALD